MKSTIPPLIGLSPGTPAVDLTDDGTAKPIRAQAVGSRSSPRSGFRPPA